MDALGIYGFRLLSELYSLLFSEVYEMETFGVEEYSVSSRSYILSYSYFVVHDGSLNNGLIPSPLGVIFSLIL